jgi:hypothetical protein
MRGAVAERWDQRPMAIARQNLRYNQGMNFVSASSVLSRRGIAAVSLAAILLAVSGCSDPRDEISSIGDTDSTTSTTTAPEVPEGPLFTRRPALDNDADAVVVFTNGFESSDERFLATVDLDGDRVVNRITTYNNKINNSTLTLVGRYADRVYVSMTDTVPTGETQLPTQSPTTIYSFSLLEDTAVGTNATSNEDEGVAEFAIANSVWAQSSASGRYIATVSFPTETKRIVEFVDLEAPRNAMGSREAKSRFEYDVPAETSNIYFWDSVDDQFVIARPGEGSQELELVTVNPDNGETELNAISTGLTIAESELSYLMLPSGEMSLRVSVPGTITTEDAEPRDFKTYALDGTEIASGSYEVQYGDNAYEIPEPTSYFVDVQRAGATQVAETYCAAASCTVKQLALFNWKIDKQRNADDVTQITEVADNLIADLIY